MAAGRHADLALVEEGAPGRGGDDGVEVRVRQDDQGGVAAQFQVRPLEVAPRGLADGPARTGGAGEGDDGDVRVGDERLADVRPAGQHVEDVLRQARSGKDGRQGEPAADRRARVRLEDDGVAEREGRGDGADGEDERGVERGDDADDAGRDAACVRKAGRLAGQDLAGGPGREGGGLVALLGGDVQLEVGLARDGSRLAHEPGAQLVGVLGEQVARTAQDGGAREVGLPGPVALGRRSGPRRGADVVRGGERDGGKALPVAGSVTTCSSPDSGRACQVFGSSRDMPDLRSVTDLRGGARGGAPTHVVEHATS